MLSKRILFWIALVLLVLSFFISVNPQPYLKFGYPGIFVFSLLGPGMFIIPAMSQFFPIPALAFVVALGMAVNDCLTWWVGNLGQTVLPKTKSIERIKRGLERYGWLFLFFWALVPFPYDLIGLVAGYIGIPFTHFLLATFAGRFIRFLLLGYGVRMLF